MIKRLLMLGLAMAALGAAPAHAADPEVEALKARLAQLEQRIGLQEDTEKVRLLAFTYAYYMDNALYAQVKALFSPNIESCELTGTGLFRGLKGCYRIWDEMMGNSYGGNKGRVDFGRMVKHYMLKDVITVAPDGRTAQGRFDYISFAGTLGRPEGTRHQVGIYTMNFVKEGGLWKISKFKIDFDAPNWSERDLATKPAIRCPHPTVKPDEPGSEHHPFPETGVVAFHYPHPVTGEQIPVRVGETRYWVGNWPGEFGGPCGVRSELLKGAAAR